MTEPNYAEFQRRIDEGRVSKLEARRMGSTHKAYGWSRNPPHWWADYLQEAYNSGYNSQLS